MNPQLLWLIPTLPFAGFLLNGTIGRKLSRPAVTAIALLFTIYPAYIVLRLWLFMKEAGAPLSISTPPTHPWIAVSGFHVDFAFTVDHLTLIMLGVVTGVGFLIHIYSAGYMAHEEGYWRFFAYLNLFMFFMLVLVLASSFLLLFVGWEGVGLASYLLIGFYFTKDSAANAGKKAFIVNRIGDFGFLLAMFLLIAHFGTTDFTGVFSKISASPLSGGFLTAIALLLVLGATGKSAQIPLYIWLPDAMEGPTPVSALIHAATMVTAGIYMVARCHILFDHSPFALTVVAIIGAATALLAATIGLVQHDIKRVLAYSTVSQLGYMFMACGVGAYSAGIFHLMTHAFFKALLFLAAGSVIHALSGEQDMRLMGGLRKRIPITFWTMTAGVFAISGIYPFSGFFSKDEILYQTFISPNPLAKLLWFVGLLTAGLTSFYMFRLWFKTFFGQPRFEENLIGHATHTFTHHASEDDLAPVHSRHDTTLTLEAEPEPSHTTHHSGIHESPWVMTIPLILLAILATIGGWVGIPAALGGHDEFAFFLAPVFATHVQNIAIITPAGAEPATASHALEITLAFISLLTAAIGFFIAYLFYYRKPGTAAALAKKFAPIYNLVDHKYWVDEIYGRLIITPLLGFSRLFLSALVDGGIIQGTSSTLAASTRGSSWLVRRIQSGNIRSYAGWLAIGAAAVIAIILFKH
jgi:NADH-quinone oxidoreductase subunit L